MNEHSLKVGDAVTVDGREGVVVRLTGQGMVDVQFEDARWVERKKGTMLRRRNPRKDDLYDWKHEQFRAVVSGIYDSLREKGIPSAEARSRAYAIATRVGQRKGWLKPGTQEPTAKGIAMSLARLGEQEAAQALLSGDVKRQKLAATKSRAGYGGRRQSYEAMLSEGRSQKYRMVQEFREGRMVYVIQPGDKAYVRKASAEAKLAELNAKRAANPRRSGFQEEVAYGREIASRRRAKTGAGKMKQISIAGIRSDWKETRARPATFHEQMETNFTPTIVSPVMPYEDPDEVGYFILTYDPRNKAIPRIVSEVKGWQFAPNLTHIAREQTVTLSVTGRGGITRQVPKIHSVIALRRRMPGGEFATMVYSVQGLRAKPKDVFETREQAEAHAHDLDVKAAYGTTPETHSVQRLPDGTYELHGPLVSRAIPRGSLVNETDHFPRYYDEGDAVAEARRLDHMEAGSAVAPLAAYRTRVGLDIDAAIEATENLLHAFEDQRVFVTRKPSPENYVLMRRGMPVEAPDPAFLGMDEAAIRRSLRATGRLTPEQIESVIQQEMARQRAFQIRTQRRLRLEATRPERPGKTRKGGRVPVEEIVGTVRPAAPRSAEQMSDEELKAALRARFRKNPPFAAIAAYGTRAFSAVRGFLATPQGKAFAAQVGTLALSMFGTTDLSQREKAVVAEAASQKSGVDVPVEAVSAALKVS